MSLNSCSLVVYVSPSRDESDYVKELKPIHPKFYFVLPCRDLLFLSSDYFWGGISWKISALLGLFFVYGISKPLLETVWLDNV